MRSASRSLVPVVGLLCAFASLRAQEPLPDVAPEAVGLSSVALERVAAHLEGAMEGGRIAGAVAGVARRGGLAYLEAVGHANIEAARPMSEASLFRIYSMSKAVTAVAVMMLWEEGHFELDDPVSEYLPAFADVRVLEESGVTRAPAGPITVRHLLLHTAGLSHRSSELYREREVRSRAIPLSRFIENVTAAPLVSDPGTAYRYSASPTVLGALVEVWSGQSLDVFMRERIFEPLGMVDTGFWVEPERADRLATVYRAEDGGLTPFEIEAVPFTERPELLEGAVGLVSTVPDFLRFSQMLLNGGSLRDTTLLRDDTVALMTANGLPDAVLASRRGSSGWGLASVSVAMEPGPDGDASDLGEYRWDGSAGTFFWNHPAEEMTIVFMWQSSPYNPDGLAQELRALVHEAIVD